MALCTFRVADAFCAVDIAGVQEIGRHVDLTTVPQSEEYVSGVMNLRGRVVTVVDLARRLGFEPTQIGEDTRNIIVRSGGEAIGLLVDYVDDVTLADPEAIEPAPANLGRAAGRYFRGVIQDDRGLIGLLDLEAVLGE